MDIVSDVPFVLHVNNKKCEYFSRSANDIYADDFPTIQIYENDEVHILFDSEDAQSRLYLAALDILPDGVNVFLDESGQLYRPVSPFPFALYEHGNKYDALRVDAFQLKIICKGEEYFSFLQVLPKQLSIPEWTMMRDDLENEIHGLAQDIVRRNIGLGSKKEGMIPPEKLYTFFVVRKYASKVLSSLIALQDAPKYRIVTTYVEKESSRAVKMDAVTIRKYLHKGGEEEIYLVPIKKVDYDIQENRLLKHIISLYDIELAHFASTIEEIQKNRSEYKKDEHIQYKELYDQGLCEFLNTANKLKKVTAIIKTQEWYRSISPLRDGRIPHSFALDSRYGALYKMYEELRYKRFKIELDPQYSYSWKKSSSLYEMWCYVKICRMLADEYSLSGNTLKINYSDDMLFPYLSNGVKMSFENNQVILDVIFDQFVPTKSKNTKLHEHPFYTVGKHTRPDITIDIYTKEDDWYIGSIILECKYRKLSSFWQGSSEWSSKPQIQAYYTDNKSDLMYGVIGGILDIRPICGVIVLTPDIQGDGVGVMDINTLIKALKPDKNNQTLNNILNTINQDIQSRLDQYEMVRKMTDNLGKFD